jgi:hypothetical protein
VQKAAFWLNSQGFRNETITIHSDSQACLAALESITVKSSLVQDCIEALNLVGNCNKLHLRWVKAHAQCSGGNDRFCARLKTDISACRSGLQCHLRSCLTILDSSRQPLFKNVRHDLVRPQRPELEVISPTVCMLASMAMKWQIFWPKEEPHWVQVQLRTCPSQL